MPELRSVSPILDGLMAGQCFAEHDGVCCYPAIRLETGEKYIIKVIRVPSSASQTEALLLTGAIASREEATAYYSMLTDEIVEEARKLNELALLEGFVGCEQVQWEKSEDGEGYEVYLLSPYRESMEVIFRQESFTQLAAMNMGLDLCAALAACRRAGLLFVDLKPENVFRMENGSYCIGDVGFLNLNNLAFASIPQKYRSSYTAPEMADCFAQPNNTLDIYALGLLLYQAYNGGVLPFTGTAPAEPLAPPMYADYELSEIILKACAPDPGDRWQDPSQIGQALTGYMQRNGVDASPIVPIPVEEAAQVQEEVAAEEDFLPDMTDEELLAAIAAEEEAQEQEHDEIRVIAALAAEDSDVAQHIMLSDEDTASDEETAQMLAQAEELMTLVPPEPVVAPEAIPVEIPVPMEETPAEAPEEAPAEALAEEVSDDPQPAAPEEAPKPKKKRKWGKLVAVLILLLLLCAAAIGSYHYYIYEYLQYIDGIQISGTDDTAVVTVISDIDDSMLTVICTDSYGNKHPGKLEGGKAVFENLNPQTRYSICVGITGFHELRGDTEGHFTTAGRTEISSLQAVVGAADGSAILTFNTSGPEPEGWKVVCTADGQETVTQSFTGNTVTVTDLNIGSEYTFTLVPEGELYLAGETQITFRTVKVITALDPVIDACHDGLLHVTWAVPEGETVESWTVRCFNGSGYDVSFVTADTQYTFDGLDHSTAATVEITAAGMTKSVTTTVGPNPITVWDYLLTTTDVGGLALSWTFTDHAPEGGWILNLTIDGVAQEAVICPDNTAQFPVFVPGALYEFSLSAADGTQLFGNAYAIAMPQAAPFSGFGLTAKDFTCRAFLAPDTENWTWKDVTEEAYTDSFAPGQKIHLMLSAELPMIAAESVVQVHIVTRNAEGAFVQSATSLTGWDSLWQDGHWVLEAAAQEAVGSYGFSVYIDGMLTATINIAVTNETVPIA